MFEVLVKSQNDGSVSNMLAMKQSNKLWSWVWGCYGKSCLEAQRCLAHSSMQMAQRKSISFQTLYLSLFLFFHDFSPTDGVYEQPCRKICVQHKTMTTNSLAFMPFVWRGGHNFFESVTSSFSRAFRRILCNKNLKIPIMIITYCGQLQPATFIFSAPLVKIFNNPI